MNLPAFCIRRPAFTIVISLVMTIMGIIGFMNLPVRWVPNVTLPQVTMRTTYNGANASLVERDVTKKLENALSGIAGIETIKSTSRQGLSRISITFKLGTNMDTAVEDIRSAIERYRADLPKDIDNPMVMKQDQDTQAILYLVFFNTRYNKRELSDYIDQYIKPSFETIDGVGSVDVYGERVSAIKVNLDPRKMAGANVTVDEVTQLLHDQNTSIPSGQIRAHDRFYSVITDTALKTPAQFNDLIIRDQNNQVVRLKDIGEAKIEAENSDSAFRVNGKSAVALGIIPQSTANPLDVEQNVQKMLLNLKRTLPAGMEVRVDYNQADYIRASMKSVYEAFLESVIFVWLVILGFLCSFRATLIPIITIPVCLISTFALLFFLGFSLNTITLMALVLAIGLVVDDAIVMLENIKRHIEAGATPFKAALQGSGEIVFPIIAMTLTLAAVYAPIAFTPGLLGVLFREFTFTLAGAVIISGIVALTLSPMMCAKILKKDNSGVYTKWFNFQLNRLQHHYRNVLIFLLRKRIWVIMGLIIIIVCGGLLYHKLPSELAPAEDMNEVDVFAMAPRSASFQYTNAYVKQLEAIYQTIPGVESYLTGMNPSSPFHSFALIKLKPNHRSSTEEIIKELTEKVSTIPLRVHVSTPPSVLSELAGSDEGDKLGLVLMTTGDYLKLQQVSKQMMAAIKKVPGFVNVSNQLKWDSEEFQVNIDRDKAADLNVPISDIANTISTFLAGKTIGKAGDANVIVQMNESSLANPNIFQQLYVRNLKGNVIPLSHIVNIKETTSPEVFNHYERLRADNIFMSLAPDFNLADAIATLQTIAKQVIPEDMKYTFTGEAKSFLESNGKTALTFALALIFIYLVLVAQFESFIDPLIIMLTVPFAVIGALLTLKLFGGTLNIYSNIGLITLIGLIAKHGILITEFANRLRAEGKSIEEAVIEAALLRLRPILMTTAAMVLGALPLALAYGAGAENRQQVGLVVTGGMLFGTLFSLFIVPIAYTYLTSRDAKRSLAEHDFNPLHSENS